MKICTKSEKSQGVCILNEKLKYDKKIILIIKITAVLILIQLARAAVNKILTIFLGQAITLTGIIFIFIGIILYFIFKPNAKSLAFNIGDKSRKSKILYILSTIMVLALIITAPMFGSDYSLSIILPLIEPAVLIPIFEELIFRGYIWDRLKNSGLNEKQVFLLVTILFSLWHLGYYDIIYTRVANNFQNVNMFTTMFFKVLTGAAFGLLTGIVRWKTKSTCSSILVHSFFNIFGR